MTYAPIKRRNHVDLAQVRPLDRFKKPHLQALLASRIRGLQRVEDAAWETSELRNLEDGFGAILDAIGAIVGRGRNGQDDADFKVSIAIQIIQNNASGVESDYYAILALLQENTTWVVLSLPDAAFIVYSDKPADDPQRVFDELEAIRVLGTGMTVVLSPVPSGQEFRFGWSGDPGVPGGALGLGWSGDINVGGKLAWQISSFP